MPCHRSKQFLVYLLTKNAMQHIILCALVYDSGMCFNLNPSHIVTSVLHVCGIRTEPNTKPPTRSI